MKSRSQIIDPVVKKCDAVKAAGGKQVDLARLFIIERATVSGWKGEYLPPLYAHRIVYLFPHLDNRPPRRRPGKAKPAKTSQAAEAAQPTNGGKPQAKGIFNRLW